MIMCDTCVYSDDPNGCGGHIYGHEGRRECSCYEPIPEDFDEEQEAANE